jgi:hypothetical protein
MKVWWWGSVEVEGVWKWRVWGMGRVVENMLVGVGVSVIGDSVVGGKSFKI